MSTQAILGTTACDHRDNPRHFTPVPDAALIHEAPCDLPASESFDEIYPLFLMRKVDPREKAVMWARYRERWVRWSGPLVSFTANGATFRMIEATGTFDVSVTFDAAARQRLHRYRRGETVTFVARLDSYDDLWRTFYLLHGDVAPPGAAPPDSGATCPPAVSDTTPAEP